MAYSANGNICTNDGRVRYRITYNSGSDTYTLPKAPELIKIAHSVAPDVFFNSSSDYDPISVDLTTLSGDYGQQIFFDVTNEKNMIFTNSVISGSCINNIYKMINITFFTSDIPGDTVSGDYIPSGDENIIVG